MAVLISVVVPVYNGQEFIKTTIQSVIMQSYPHWEMLIIDDGSTDGTKEVVKGYLEDSRIKYFYQKNRERAAARNQGIHFSSGQYIAFLDADDAWLPDKLEVQVDYLKHHPEVRLCFTNYFLIDTGGILTGAPRISFTSNNQFDYLLKGNFIANSTVMIPRDVLDKVGLFDETLPAFGSEDWDMWLRIVRFYSVHFIDKPLALYRIHENNTSLDRMCSSAEAVLKKTFSDPNLPANIFRSKEKIYAQIYLGFSETCLRSNQKKKAVEYWQRAYRTYPTLLFLTERGIWATLKLLLPYSIISNFPKLRLLLQRGISDYRLKESKFN